METVKVVINDEPNGRQITINLTPVQYERAQREPEYVEELIREYDASNNTERINNIETTESQQISVEPEGRSIFIWNEACIYLLLSLYEEHQEDFLSKRHKIVYDIIAKKMKEINSNLDVTGPQCHSKIISLKKTYKKIVDHNNTSGNNRESWPYYDRMNELFGATGWANPAAVASELGPEETPLNPTSTEPEIQTKRRKFESVFEEYRKDIKKHREERAKVKQENFIKLMELKEKQHKEKLELLKQLLGCNRKTK